MTMKKSIYEIITENLTPEGRLPYYFDLRPKSDPGQISFMPGAQDGIGMCAAGESAERAAEKIAELIISGAGNEAQIAEIITEYRALSVVDKVTDILYEKRSMLDAKHIADCAGRLAFECGEVEAVKLGITMFGMLDLSRQPLIVEKLCVLAAYEDLTRYVTAAVRSLGDDFNDVLFMIAKRVSGWGKIDAVEELEPTSDEIRRWLLTDGCFNMIGNDYLGLECAKKGGMISALRGEPDDELFEGICMIMSALVEDGPADGMKHYDHAAEAMELFAKMAPKRIKTVFQLLTLFELRDWLRENEVKGGEKLAGLYEEVSDKPEWRALALELLEKPEDDGAFDTAVRVGEKMGLDLTAKVVKAIKAMPNRYHWFLYIPYKDPTAAKDMTEFLENTLPLSEMSSGMGDYWYSPTYTNEHRCLDHALQQLNKYPHMGEKLVAAGLGSPVTGERNMACRALEKWSEQLGLPLKTMCPELYALIKKIAPTEVNENTKANMEKLLR